MDNVIAFTPRPRAPLPPVLPPLAGIGLRAHLEETAQTALDAADQILAALDRIGDDDEAALSLRGAPASVELAPAPEPMPEPAPQEVPSSEPEMPETAPEEIALPEPVYEPIRLPWRGAGNVVSAAGCAVLALMAGA